MTLLPPGFRAIAALSGALLATGAAQLVALAVRDEPYPLCAAALALLLLAGGAVLAFFTAGNVARGIASDERSEKPTAGGWLTAAALGLLAAQAALLWVETGVFFPFRMGLFWGGTVPLDRLREPPLAMMLAGTCLVALGALATAALCGALWTWLCAQGRLRRMPAKTLVSLAGALPYLAFALLVRALVCKPVAFLAAGRYLALRPGDDLAYRSMLGAAPGLLAAALSLGLALGRGLWSWLDGVRAAEERSESFLTALVRGERAWSVVLRHGVWLRRRRELGALLLSGMAAAALIDVLSGALIDSFRGAGFPPYPSLAAALFLRGIGPDGTPAALPGAWSIAHLLVVLAALVLVLAQAVPLRQRRISLSQRTLRVNGQVLAREVPGAQGVAPRPAVQWVLGLSGAGKSMLLEAWAAQLGRAALAPQDPDQALPGVLSATDVAFANGAVSDLLGRLDDRRVQERLADPFTPLAAFSRGERQRLMLCIALARARAEADCTLLLDEPTSAQDGARAQALVDCLREVLSMPGKGSVIVTSHDAAAIRALFADRAPLGVVDHVLWLEAGRARAACGASPFPAGLQRYFGAIDRLLDAPHLPDLATGDGKGGTRVLPADLTIAGRSHRICADARVRGGELTVLSGPSGSGKTTLLRAICEDPRLWVGYVAQDTSRAFPLQMPVAEVLGKGRRGAGRWFGADLAPQMLRRSVGALSEGERQRVILAAEAQRLDQKPAGAPRLLLLDEPFGALDPPARLRLLETLLSWLRQSADNAAVLVSHSPLVDLGLARAFGIPATEWIMGEVQQ